MNTGAAWWTQAAFDVVCEWGEPGVSALAPVCDGVIIVDVLSFCTTVDAAVAAGASVYPCRWRDHRAVEQAGALGAVLAGPRGGPGFSLSPLSMAGVVPGTRIVLPSPNGATLSLMAGTTLAWAGCLRNAAAVAAAASRTGRRLAVIPAGERWPDGGLRPALEDWLGAGAIISRLPGSRSPEAQAAAEAFAAARADLAQRLRQSASGQELIVRGYATDVDWAAQVDASTTVSRLVAGAYRAAPWPDRLLPRGNTPVAVG